MNAVKEKTDKEVLTALQRWGELIIVVALVLLLAFFANHQSTNTGFFTAKFGLLEMVLLYGSILFALIAPIMRALSGRRNPARPLEAASSLFTAIAGLWFLIVFPFNFSHFADTLPTTIRFLFAWITDDIGKIPLILQVILGPISALVTTLKYLSTRRREPEPTFRQRTS
jgi:uncharacterized membrane protein HdeD (DUF308 family)